MKSQTLRVKSNKKAHENSIKKQKIVVNVLKVKLNNRGIYLIPTSTKLFKLYS
jgi:hypothetical protein